MSDAIKNRRSIIEGGLALALTAAFSKFSWGQDPQPPEAIIYVCPMHPDVQSRLPGKCQKCNMKLVAAGASAAGGDFFICPMHTDVTASQSGVCPKCKMKLVKSAPPEPNEFTVKINTTPPAIRPGRKARFHFTVFHPVTEKQIREFNILHDMPFHLFVISQDFEEFQHIHPTRQADGSFVIDTIMPRPGYYKIFCDFFPVGGTPQVVHRNLMTAGFQGDLAASVAKLEPDQQFVKTIEGTRFELKFNPAEPYAGRPAELHYHIVDERSGEPVRNLAPYLGAWGHTLILSEDATDYLHSHPTEMVSEDVDRKTLRGGPDVVFDTFFPRPGNYRIWSQFQRADKLITVPYSVSIPRLK